jgi:hypothetical protein
MNHFVPLLLLLLTPLVALATLWVMDSHKIHPSLWKMRHLRRVDELTHALGKAYGGEARLLKCLGSQGFSLKAFQSVEVMPTKI